MRDDQIELLAKDISNYAFGAVVLGDGNLASVDFPAVVEKFGGDHAMVLTNIRNFVRRRIKDTLGQG